MTRKIGQQDFLKNHILTNLKVHPNGKIAVFFDTTLEMESNCYRQTVHLIDLSSESVTALKLSVFPDDFYFFEDYIVFKVIEESKTTFFSYLPETKVLDHICEIPFIAMETGFGEKIYFITNILNENCSSGILCGESVPLFQEGRGFTGKTVKGLFEVDFSGRNIRVISNIDVDVDLVEFDLDHGKILFTAFDTELQRKPNSNIFTYDVRTEQLHKHTCNQFRIDSLKAMPKALVVFMGVNLSTHCRNDNQQVYCLNLVTDEITPLGDPLDMSNERPGIVTDACFSKGEFHQRVGETYYHLRLDGSRQCLAAIQSSGELELIDTGLTTISNFSILEDKIILIGMRGQTLSELYKYQDGVLWKLTNFNDWLFDYEISKPEPLEVLSEGVTIQGWVFPPLTTHPMGPHTKEKEAFPGILMIHGGPKMAYSDVFSFDVQMFCAQGYYAFYCNPMGSDGRGDAFADIRGNFADLPYRQIMDFTDEVLKKHTSLSSDRIGVTGGSYGGYMTNWIITRTQRFKAAISERGISNMLNMLTSSDIGFAFAAEYAGVTRNPWEEVEILLKISPILSAKEVMTPTLFNHGKEDCRCHHTESLNMHAALCQNGVASKLCLYEGENHSLAVRGKPKSKERRNLENSSWFEKYLKRG